MFSPKSPLFPFSLMGGLVLIYIICKASAIAITHDEAYSFFIMKNFWYVEALCTGNTHWLNSAAIQLAISAGLEQVMAIRWLSLLSAGVFIATILLFIRGLQLSSPLVLFALALCLLNPYVLDYFSIARGYASGLMLETLALFFFIKGKLLTNARLSFYALCAAALSIFANYSFAYFFLSFACYYFFDNYFLKKNNFFRSIYFYRDGLIFALTALFLIRAVIFLKSCSNDYVGAGTDNFSYFLGILPSGLCYNRFHFSPLLICMLNYFIFIFLSCIGIYGFFFKTNPEHLNFRILSGILLLLLLTITLSHFLAHATLPANRSALFLFPISALSLICWMNSLPRSAYFNFLLLICSGALVLNFFISANFKYNIDFKFNANIKEVFDILELQKAESVGLSSGFYGAYRNYYTQKLHNPYHFHAELIKADDNQAMLNHASNLNSLEFLVLLPPYDLHFYQLKNIQLKAINFFPESEAVIFKINAK